MRRLLKILILVFFGFAWLNGPTANATDYNSPVVRKALLTGVERCYKNGLISTSAGKISEFKNFGDLILSGDNGHYIGLPSGLTDIEDSDVSCEELFMGYSGLLGGNFEGIFKLAGRVASPSSSDDKIKLLEGMGYEKVENDDSENEERINFTYNQTTHKSTSQVETDTIVAKLDADGVITELKIEYTGNYAMPPGGTSQGLAFFTVVDGRIQLTRARIPPQYQGMLPTYYSTTKGVGDLWDGDNGFLADLRSTISRRGNFSYTYTPRGGYSLTYEYSLEGNSTAGNYNPNAASDAVYEIPFGDIYGPVTPDAGINKALNSAIQYLSSNSLNSVEDLSFSDNEKIALLTASLKSYFFTGKSPSDYWVCDVLDWADYGAFLPEHEIHVSSDGSIKRNCRLDVSKLANDGKIHGFSGSKFDASGNTELSLSETINEINRLVGELPDDTETIVPPTPGDGGGESTSTVNCFTEGGSLGWILCPILELAGGATEGIYHFIVEKWLTVGVSEMSPDTAVHVGWKQFCDIANIIFVIMLLIIIFSQVTGLGLTNYGIKKTLPTLIMVAILVNLSFVMCQIAVDATNIIGDTLQKIFSDLESAIKGEPGEPWLLVGGISTFIQLGGAVAVVGTISIVSGGIDLFGALLIPALVGIITALFSVVFFFLILAVRRCAIIVLVVLAPVAIICYALPNTKNIYKRWLKVFTSLLLVYPICSIMMGGGQFFSSLLLANGENNFFMALSAMLLQVVPFFLIPSMVKGSVSAIGNIGAKISQTGKNWSRLTSGNFAKSDAAKRMQANVTNWGRKRPINNKLRNTRGIGRIVRSIEDNKVTTALRNSKIATANRARKDAMAKNAVEQIRRQDNLVTNRAAWSDEDTSERALANDNLKLQRELADNELDSLNATGTYKTSDGVIHRFNNNDPGSIQEQLQILEEDLATNPGDMKIVIRIEAMKKLLQTKFGSKGASLVSETLYNWMYDEHGNMTTDTNRIANAEVLAQQFARDDKLMAELHRNDPGTEQFINDLANRSAIDENGYETQAAIDAKARLNNGRAGYGAFSAGKVKAANLADSADTLINNMSKMDPGSAEFNQLAETFRQAIADYRTGSNFKANDIKKINEMLKSGYDLERNTWLNGSTNGVNNYETLTGYVDDGNGNMIEVHADGIENGKLVRHITNSSGQVVQQELHVSASADSAILSANLAYSHQVSAFIPAKVGQPQLKIQQLRELPEPPEGYDKDGHWDYAKMQRTETQRDKLTYKNWVDRTLAIEQANEQARKINDELALMQREYEVKIQHQGGNNP